MAPKRRLWRPRKEERGGNDAMTGVYSMPERTSLAMNGAKTPPIRPIVEHKPMTELLTAVGKSSDVYK